MPRPTDADTPILTQSAQNSDVPTSRSSCISDSIHSAVHDVVEKFPILRVLHDHEDGLGCLDDLVELGDGGVSDQFEDVQLACDSFYVSHVFDFVFLEYFDGNWLVGVIMYGFFDFAEGALADGGPD